MGLGLGSQGNVTAGGWDGTRTTAKVSTGLTGDRLEVGRQSPAVGRLALPPGTVELRDRGSARSGRQWYGW